MFSSIVTDHTQECSFMPAASSCCSLLRTLAGLHIVQDTTVDKPVQGFVRIAVQTGSPLVPVLSFGENNIFQVSKPKGKSIMAQVQK